MERDHVPSELILRVKAEVLRYRESLRGERFIEFDPAELLRILVGACGTAAWD